MDAKDELDRIAGDVEQQAALSPVREMPSAFEQRIADSVRLRLPQLRAADIGAVLLITTDVLLAEYEGLLEPGVTTPVGIAAILQATGARLYRDGTALG